MLLSITILAFKSVDSFGECQRVLVEAERNNDLYSALHRINGTGITLGLENGDRVSIRCQHSFINGVITRAIALTSDHRYFKSKTCQCEVIQEYGYARNAIDKFFYFLQEPLDDSIKIKIENRRADVQTKIEQFYLYKITTQPDLDSVEIILKQSDFTKLKS